MSIKFPKAGLYLNYKFGSYVTKNTVRVVYECKPVNATQENNRYLMVRDVQIRHESTICKIFAILILL
jgi:hypothetical protein